MCGIARRKERGLSFKFFGAGLTLNLLPHHLITVNDWTDTIHCLSRWAVCAFLTLKRLQHMSWLGHNRVSNLFSAKRMPRKASIASCPDNQTYGCDGSPPRALCMRRPMGAAAQKQRRPECSTAPRQSIPATPRVRVLLSSESPAARRCDRDARRPSPGPGPLSRLPAIPSHRRDFRVRSRLSRPSRSDRALPNLPGPSGWPVFEWRRCSESSRRPLQPHLRLIEALLLSDRGGLATARSP
jgi:hypothetical protein